MLLILFAFLAGLATILAPCIWPVLPIVLSSSLGSKTRPLGITIGVVLSFSFFTLFLSTLVRLFHLDPNIFRLFSVLVIGFFGLTLLIPALSLLIESLISRLSGISGSNQSKKGFWGGFLIGLSLGVVWSPCAGPILAAIAALSSMGHVTSQVVVITLSYAIGAGVPLLIISYGSQRLIQKVKAISSYTGVIQRIFGVVMILMAIAIYTNLDTELSASLLNIFPQFATSSNSLENNPIVSQGLSGLTGNSLEAKGAAPDFVGITNWLNIDKPLKISDLKGKVVLVDFWTYTCINCIRTLPFVTSWYDKYKDQGFVVVGIHTPEFEFEKDTANVASAIKQFNIHYPVAQDNNYSTWNNYSNQYWPAEYLIDASGNIRETHFGEGNYDETEKNIQALLKEAGHSVSTGLVNAQDQTPTQEMSPETYLGSAKAEFYYPNQQLNPGVQQFTLNQSLPPNSFDLGGSWNITQDAAITGQNSTLEYNFVASKVFLVLKPPSGSTGQVKVFLDGKVVDSSSAGSDVKDGLITVDSDRLYNLINLKATGNHTLRLEFQTSGTECFAFTFG